MQQSADIYLNVAQRVKERLWEREVMRLGGYGEKIQYMSVT